MLLQQLKLSQLTSSSQNEVQQDNARLKAKLKLLENVKKDELMKKLDAKEHECLEYRARLDRSAQPASFTLDESSLTPVAILEAEVERKMKELKQEMEDSRAKIAGLVQDMQIIKTTTREKILVPFIADHSEMAELDELESRRVPMDFRIDNAESQIAQQQEES